MTLTHPRVQRGAGIVIAAAVAALLFLGAGRSLAAVTVPNCSAQNITVNALTDSALITIPSSTGNPTLVTVTDKTANDGIMGIASFAINWINTPPQSLLWTGTARGVVVGGQTTVPDTNLGSIGVAVTVVSAVSAGNLNRIKIRNNSGVNAAVNIFMVW